MKRYFVLFYKLLNYMKYCPECGKALASETSNFCDNCGTKFNNVNPPQQKEIVNLLPNL